MKHPEISWLTGRSRLAAILVMTLSVGYGMASHAAGAMDARPHVAGGNVVERGRYLVVFGGCNDCHTQDFLFTEGNVPESKWLAGNTLGFRGPWGTTYPPNLRLRAQEWTEEAFVTTLKSRKALPPMPWMNLNHIDERDAAAIYQYIRSLGPLGEHMPAAVPPDQEPTTPYVDMNPANMPAQ